VEDLATEVEKHIQEFALHRALESIWRVIAKTNAYVNKTEPWVLAKEGNEEALAEVLSELYGTLRCIGQTLSPFLPDTTHRLLQALSTSTPIQLFPRLVS
jgi:methionyl-tRNA synthetase